MEVEVPQAVDVLGLEAAHLALLEPGGGTPSARSVGEATLLQESVGLHEAPQRGVRRQRPARGIRAHHHRQVVVVELIAPTPVRGVLLEQRGAERLADRGLLTGVATDTCVESTGRDAYFIDYYVSIVSDCCAAASESDHAGALKRFDRDYGAVVTSGEVIGAWERLGALPAAPVRGLK